MVSHAKIHMLWLRDMKVKTMQRSKNDLWVGLFVLIGAAAILFLALKSANLLSLNFDTSYKVTARFDNIGGLKPRAAVKSAGVVIGRVENISFDDKSYQASVNLAMESKYVFPKDSSLKILTSGLLGEQYIGIEAGAAEGIERLVAFVRIGSDLEGREHDGLFLACARSGSRRRGCLLRQRGRERQTQGG